MSIVDIHTHAFPDSLAERAMTKLLGKADWPAPGDGTVGGLVASMAKAGVERSALCPIATRPGQWEGIVQWLEEVCRRYKGKIIPIASLHPKDENPREIIAQIAQAGMVGIKLHPMYQDFVVDADELMPIYQAIRDADLIVTLHCGRDIGFPNDSIVDRASPARLANVLRAVPGLKMLCTHMGGFMMWDGVEKHLVGMDVYLETSFGLTHIAPEQFRRIVAAHGPERICFGSDWPWNDQTREQQRFVEAGLDEETIEIITKRSARLLLGEPV